MKTKLSISEFKSTPKTPDQRSEGWNVKSQDGNNIELPSVSKAYNCDVEDTVDVSDIGDTEDTEDTKGIENSSISLHHNHHSPKHSPAQKHVEQEEFEKDLKELHPKLWKYFDRHVLHPYRDIKAGERNATLVELGTKLYYQVHFDLACKFLEGLYIFYGDRFKDTFEKHQEEYLYLVRSVKESFLGTLSSDEKEYYDCLVEKPREAEAFRICRSLAAYESEDSPVGILFLSSDELGMRLGIKHNQTTDRILRTFERQDVLWIKVKGTQRTKGNQGRATLWKWGFPLNVDKDHPTPNQMAPPRIHIIMILIHLSEKLITLKPKVITWKYIQH